MTPAEWAWLLVGVLGLTLLGLICGIWATARLIAKILADIMGKGE